MYIRATTTKNKKTGKSYTTHRLVETVQTEKGPRQRMVLSIGKLDLPKPRWKELAKALEYRLAGMENIAPDDIRSVADEVMANRTDIVNNREAKAERESKAEYESIDLNSVGSADSRTIGPELACCSTWKLLGFDEILSELGFSEREISLSKIVIMGRLIQPGSDHSTWEWFRERSSLSELLPKEDDEVGRNSIYEIADLLLAHKESIEKALYQKTIGVHNVVPSVFLFDLTNLYFEGQCKKNTLAHFGKSKEKRSDCRLVTLALMVDQNGFPVGSKIYRGNQAEPPTLRKILEEYIPENAEEMFKIRPTIIMDRGIATRDNIDLLIDKKLNYAIVERYQDLNSYIDEFKNNRDDFIEIKRAGKESVWAKSVALEQRYGSKIICISEARKAKEKAIIGKKEQRFVADIERLRSSIEKGTISNTSKVFERIGRLKERYGKVTHFYEITPTLSSDGKKVTELAINREHHQEEDTYGCYSIETSHENMDPETLWKLYMTLTRVESSFRSMKTDLGTRPIFHQLASRTSGHLFISVLAYHLLISMEHRFRESGETMSWKRAREVLSTHQRQTVVMTNEKSEIIHIRVTGTPESAHKKIYRALEVNVEQQRLISRVGFRL
jgi:transposase